MPLPDNHFRVTNFSSLEFALFDLSSFHLRKKWTDSIKSKIQSLRGAMFDIGCFSLK